MAGEWLKVEKATADKPEIFAIAERLGIDPDAVLGKCIRVWNWFDSHTTNGTANGAGVTKALIDRLTGVTGFAESMLFVEWLVQLEGDLGGFALPNFDRHNGETAKQRALTAKRVAKHKNAEGNAKVTDAALPREEKRREDIEPKTLAPSAKKGSRLADDWELPSEWAAWCKQERPDLNPKAVAATFADFWHAKAGKDACKLDWQATWRNWVRNTKAANGAPAPVVDLEAKREAERLAALDPEARLAEIRRKHAAGTNWGTQVNMRAMP